MAETSTHAGPGGQKAMVRTPEWKYVYCAEGGTEELYDMRLPDGELHNLTADPSCRQTRAALRAYLIQWCREHGDEQLLQDGDLLSVSLNEQPATFNVGSLGWRWY